MSLSRKFFLYFFLDLASKNTYNSKFSPSSLLPPPRHFLIAILVFLYEQYPNNLTIVRFSKRTKLFMLLNDRWRYVRLIELSSTHAQVIHVKRRVTLTFHSAFVMYHNAVRVKFCTIYFNLKEIYTCFVTVKGW